MRDDPRITGLSRLISRVLRPAPGLGRMALALLMGALGWMSLLAGRKPVFPDMPVLGLFRVIRQPIYVAFALTLWTVPVWTPDQLALAVSYAAYCLLAPRLKERRFAARYGSRFARYQRQVPYVMPGRRSRNAQ